MNILLKNISADNLNVQECEIWVSKLVAIKCWISEKETRKYQNPKHSNGTKGMQKLYQNMNRAPRLHNRVT